MDTNNLAYTLESVWHNIIDFLPTIIGVIIILIVGFIVAKIIAKIVKSAMKKADKKMSHHSGRQIKSARSVSKFVYYILVIITLLIALSILGVEGVLSPLENMLNEFLLFIPNLIAALIIGYIGYILAKVISELVGSAAKGLQSKSKRIVDSDSVKLDKIVTPIIFILIFIPILIVALDALQMNAISEPATDMLYGIFNAIPEILAGIIILAIFFAIAKFLAPIVTNLLKEMGADKIPSKIGMKEAMGDSSLSKIAGKVLFFFIMFFGVVSALNKMELHQISFLLGDLLELAGQIFFGLVIIAVGSFIAKIAYKSLSSKEGETLASIARYTILGLFIAIALRFMGIANEIVILAFTLTLGAAAVAIALSFGLGGREAAGKQMEYILKKFRKKEEGGSSDKSPGSPGHSKH